MVGISGALRSLRRPLEEMKGEVDQVLAKVDEGLKSIGPEELCNLEHAKFVTMKSIYSVRAQPALKSPVVV